MTIEEPLGKCFPELNGVQISAIREKMRSIARETRSADRQAIVKLLNEYAGTRQADRGNTWAWLITADRRLAKLEENDEL